MIIPRKVFNLGQNLLRDSNFLPSFFPMPKSSKQKESYRKHFVRVTFNLRPTFSLTCSPGCLPRRRAPHHIRSRRSRFRRRPEAIVSLLLKVLYKLTLFPPPFSTYAAGPNSFGEVELRKRTVLFIGISSKGK